MRAAFFHDHRFGRDRSGTYYSNGALPYRALARYVRQFDHLLVVARVQPASSRTRTVASGAGVEMACLESSWRLALPLGSPLGRHVRKVMSAVDCAIIRLPSLIGRVACQEAIRAGKPWMVEVVGCALESLWNHGSLPGKVLAVPTYLLIRRCVERAPFALYVSESFLQHRYPSRGRSVACSNVVIDAPRPGVLQSRLARLDAGVDPRRAVLGLIGSLDVDYKGHETAIHAIARMKDRFPHVELRCLGGGAPARWRRLAARLGVESNVRFDGSLPGGAPVLEWLDGLDVILTPSRTEGLPRALIEAMSRALPALGSSVGGIPELIAEPCLHPARDDRALAELIERLLGAPEEMKAQARRNWERAGAYSADILERRRFRFLAEFRAFAAESTRERGGCAGDPAPVR